MIVDERERRKEARKEGRMERMNNNVSTGSSSV
jgi:hypothetical protein